VKACAACHRRLVIPLTPEPLVSANTCFLPAFCLSQRRTLGTTCAKLHAPVPSLQLVFTAANGDVVECGEEQGVTQGITPAPEDAATDDDAAESADIDEVHPLPKGQDTDPHGFPTKDSFFISPLALPASVAAVTLLVTNFSGGGMANVCSLHARVSDASSDYPHAARDLFVYCMPHERGAHAGRSVAALVKLYREYAGAPCLALPVGPRARIWISALEVASGMPA
jgi:hypothetical protein